MVIRCFSSQSHRLDGLRTRLGQAVPIAPDNVCGLRFAHGKAGVITQAESPSSLS